MVSAICITMFLWCCGREKSKMEIPEGIEVTRLLEILENPIKYHGKNVLLSGFVNSVCPSGCDMVYQEGAIAVTIYPKGFKFPKMKKGQPIKVYAEVTAGEERVIISALKFEVLNPAPF